MLSDLRTARDDRGPDAREEQERAKRRLAQVERIPCVVPIRPTLDFPTGTVRLRLRAAWPVSPAIPGMPVAKMHVIDVKTVRRAVMVHPVHVGKAGNEAEAEVEGDEPENVHATHSHILPRHTGCATRT